MSEYLVDHAVRNVWCNPKQDKQIIYRPQRISNPRGVRGHITHTWDSYRMPTSTDIYHVYQIGQFAPHLLGLDSQQNVWRSLASLMNEKFLIADLYTINGLHLCRFNSFVLITSNKNVLLAIREQKNIADLKTTPVFLRLYSNAFFESVRSDGFAHEIQCYGANVQTQQQALDIQRDYLALRERAVGYTWLYVNGLYQSDYIPTDFAVGDFVEYVYDSSVKAIKEFSIQDLDTFDSIRDSNRKYLLHYPGPQVGGTGIDYRDDIDLYLIKPGINGRYAGVHYHKNNDDGFTQITHRDYGISVDYIIAHQLKMVDRGWINIDQLKIQAFIRHSGYQRPLMFESNRIQELYKLNETNRYNAMIGIDSTVPSWRVEHLENSDYVKVMDVRYGSITTELVKDAYGYNAIAKLIGDTPQRVQNISGRRVVPLPFGVQVNSTAFELNAAGKLIASYIHTSGVEYTPFNNTCQMVEMIIGRGGSRLDMQFNKQDVTINPKFSYRFYVAPIVHGVLQNNQWTDITGDSSKYAIINGKVRWFVDLQYNAVCVKSDSHFLNYELNVAVNNGLLRFSINASTTWDGVQQSSLLYIPPGRLDVWLNDECLIEGLDYFVKWPQVVITNKKYLRAAQTQKIRVRGTGFCNTNMVRQPPKEAGFVRWGKLSRNNRFDLRDDRVIRLVVNGRTYHRDDITFTEDGASLAMANVPNGSPYTLEDLVIPLRNVVSDDTYALRAQSLIVDEQVSDYLTLKNPEPIPINPDPIPDKYAIYSPFAASIMYDLLTERLSTEDFRGQYSDQNVRDYLSDYEWLLDYEPTRHNIDLTHVVVHPHDRATVVELDAYQYFLLNRAIKVFLQDKVDITRFMRIKDSFI
jgi:hypothetical protein